MRGLSREWKEVRLGESDLEIEDGDRGKNYPNKSQLLEEGYCPFINNKNIVGNKLNFEGVDFISKEKDEILGKGKAYPGDIILTTRGSVGNVALFHSNVKFNFLRINSGMVIIRNNSMFDLNFLYQQFKSSYFKSQINSLVTGSAQPQLPIRDIKKLNLILPPLKEQKAIAHILSTLDEKIEVNNQINKKLEEMAQTIFKHWFVDFEFPNENGEPYKSSGGEMVESELGMIPKGWEVVELSKLVDTIDNRGKTPPQENERTIYPILDVKALSGDGRIIDYENCMKYVSQETYDSWFRSGHPKEGDILLSTVGSLAEMKIFYGSIGCIAQNVVALRCNDISNLYMYQYLKHIKNDLISYNIGSVQPSIKITHVIKHKILRPDIEVEKQFDKLISDISKLIYKNHLQSSRIKELRDLLLPKLMSGEIRVPLEEGDIQ